MYFDTAYIAKFYVEEPESGQVRNLVRKMGPVRSSIWAMAEFHAVIHRRKRQGMDSDEASEMAAHFSEHLDDGVWELVALNANLLRKTGHMLLKAPPDLFLRAGDAVHLMTAYEIGEREIWTNDRRMLKAAPYFGLKGRSV